MMLFNFNDALYFTAFNKIKGNIQGSLIFTLQNLFSTLIKRQRKITQVLKSEQTKQERTWSVCQANLPEKKRDEK